MSYSANLSRADIAPELAGRPLAEIAPLVLDALAWPKQMSAAIRELVEPPTRAVLPWQPSDAQAEIVELRLDGYPDYAVLTRTAALEEWDRHSRSEESTERRWGEEWAELAEECRAKREKVRSWLEELPSTSLVIAMVWDDS